MHGAGAQAAASAGNGAETAWPTIRHGCALERSVRAPLQPTGVRVDRRVFRMWDLGVIVRLVKTGPCAATHAVVAMCVYHGQVVVGVGVAMRVGRKVVIRSSSPSFFSVPFMACRYDHGAGREWLFGVLLLFGVTRRDHTLPA